MSMRWIEITIETTEDASDAVCEMLAQLGADGIAVCDPEEIRRIIEDPESLSYADDGYVDSLGESVVIRSYFAEFSDGIRLGAKEEEYANPDGVGAIYGQIATGVHTTDEVFSVLKERLDNISQFLPIGKGMTGHRYVEEEDWANSWKKYYSILHISPRVVICPSWEDYDLKEDEVVVSLDPGSAFGTGTHETTSMCAEIIDRVLTDADNVLDLGCGSGILSIIAAKLGARSIEAIDIDRLAVKVAQENIERNEVTVDCHTGELKDAHRNEYDLLVANIVADVIIPLSKEFSSYLAPDGHLLVSGIINTKAEAVKVACAEAGFRLTACHQKGDWRAFLFDLSTETPDCDC